MKTTYIKTVINAASIMLIDCMFPDHMSVFVFARARMHRRLAHVCLRALESVNAYEIQPCSNSLCWFWFRSMSLDRDISQSIISVLQRHQNPARRAFRGLGSSTTSKRWSKHFHLNNGCSNLNDLTGTSSRLTEAGYYKESVIHIWAELRQLQQVQRHTILFRFIPLNLQLKPPCKICACEGTHRLNNRCAKKDAFSGAARCSMKIPCWLKDSHTIL